MVNTLYISTSGSVNFDFREAGSITAIAIQYTNAASGYAEVSFNSSGSPTTNDTTGVLAGVALTTGGTSDNALFVLNEPVDVGERMFLHVTGTNNVVRVFVFTSGASTPRTTRRR